MARVKLDLPQSFAFSTPIEIGIGLINYGGHLGNDSALTLVHEARLRFLASFGFNELDIEGRGLIQADAVLVYKAQVHWGDVLIAEVTVDDFNKYGCDFYYRFRQRDTGRDVLHAKTGLVFFDYAARRTVSVPPSFIVAMGAVAPQGENA
ncbi:acyl-CoA thioesterase [Chitinimonas lacunae]|uniref:Acyl-CoA thioesterase n=1 Tax=Chitinimonas lacunae TaxID=1963018 RepID=A0ABV8MKQ4_9NEIS